MFPKFYSWGYIRKASSLNAGVPNIDDHGFRGNLSESIHDIPRTCAKYELFEKLRGVTEKLPENVFLNVPEMKKGAAGGLRDTSTRRHNIAPASFGQGCLEMARDLREARIGKVLRCAGGQHYEIGYPNSSLMEFFSGERIEPWLVVTASTALGCAWIAGAIWSWGFGIRTIVT